MPLESIRTPLRERHGKTYNNLLQNHKAQSFHILYVAKCVVVLFINPANHDPRVKNGTTPRVISSHRHIMGKKHKKNLILRIPKAQSFHILCVAMYSGPLYKSG